MIDIYVLRHGDAQPRAEGLPEADRKLTPKGRRDVDRVMRHARAAKVKIDLALTSPYRRAIETAEIAVKVLDPKPRLVETSALLPESRPEQVWKEVRSHSDAKGLLLAGHEPQLSQLIGYLLGTPALRLDLKKGALVRIRMERAGAVPHGELKWLLTPRLACGG